MTPTQSAVTAAAAVQIGEGARGFPEDPYLEQVSDFCLLGKGKGGFRIRVAADLEGS